MTSNQRTPGALIERIAFTTTAPAFSTMISWKSPKRTRDNCTWRLGVSPMGPMLHCGICCVRYRYVTFDDNINFHFQALITRSNPSVLPQHGPAAARQASPLGELRVFSALRSPRCSTHEVLVLLLLSGFPTGTLKAPPTQLHWQGENDEVSPAPNNVQCLTSRMTFCLSELLRETHDDPSAPNRLQQ